MAERFSRTADGGRRVPLARPIQTHGAPITAILLRAPRWTDYMDIGEIQIASRSGDTVTVVDDNEAIRAYADRLMQAEAQEFKGQLGLADALALKDAIRDFFEEARSVTPASNSSSDMAGAPATSGT